MRITARQLRSLIREAVQEVMQEDAAPSPDVLDAADISEKEYKALEDLDRAIETHGTEEVRKQLGGNSDTPTNESVMSLFPFAAAAAVGGMYAAGGLAGKYLAYKEKNPEGTLLDFIKMRVERTKGAIFDK